MAYLLPPCQSLACLIKGQPTPSQLREPSILPHFHGNRYTKQATVTSSLENATCRLWVTGRAQENQHSHNYVTPANNSVAGRKERNSLLFCSLPQAPCKSGSGFASKEITDKQPQVLTRPAGAEMPLKNEQTVSCHGPNCSP